MEDDLDKKEVLFGWILETYGKRCKDYEQNCACCVAWTLYDRLTQKKPLV